MRHSSTSLVALAAAGGFAALAATSAGAQDATWATVTQTRPIYSQISDPQQRCWSERVVDTTVMRLDEAPIGARGQVIERPGSNDLLATPQARDVQRCTTVDATRMQLSGYEGMRVAFTHAKSWPGLQARSEPPVLTTSPGGLALPAVWSEKPTMA